MNKFKDISGGVTAPQGFVANAVECGIKNPAKPRLDLALICSQRPTVTAAVFTRNQVKAAPIQLCQKHIKSGDLRAIIANSGNANACTGHRGNEDACSMSRLAAEQLGLQPSQVLVASTGIIGQPMPMDRISGKIPPLAKGLGRDKGELVARAIMTSDTRPKTAAVEVRIGAKKVRIGAVAKGAGMICPNMGTMLCFVTTDARIGQGELKHATRQAVDRTFNRISIDGDTSTNDTVIVMANGASGQRKIQPNSASAHLFGEALEHVLLQMAKAIVRDGERVTKFVEISVRNARNNSDARLVAETVANSLLVKCSWNGGDPNWGRVMHAIGYSGAKIREELIHIYFDGMAACRHGVAALDTPLEKLRTVTARREFTVLIDLGMGRSHHNVFTSDLSQEYVDFNRTEYAAPAGAGTAQAAAQ
jgi:glutamate N-acetyltransferase/amino-acid N-acetyltransferase